MTKLVLGKWNKIKKKTNADEKRLYTTREVWWCRFGVNVGAEQDGSGETFLRPAVIVRAFGPDVCLVIPLTTSPRRHPLRVAVGEIQGKEASALLSQMRIIDTRRLIEKIGFLGKGPFGEIRKAVRKLF